MAAEFRCSICGNEHPGEERAFRNATNYGRECWNDYLRVKRRYESSTNHKFSVQEYRVWRKQRNLPVPRHEPKKGRPLDRVVPVGCKSCGRECITRMPKNGHEALVCSDCEDLFRQWKKVEPRLTFGLFVMINEMGRETKGIDQMLLGWEVGWKVPAMITTYLDQRERAEENLLQRMLEHDRQSMLGE